MVFSIVNDRYYYDSAMSLSAAARQAHPSGKYFSRRSGRSPRKSPATVFRPIKPSYIRQPFRDGSEPRYHNPYPYYGNYVPSSMNTFITSRQPSVYRKRMGKAAPWPSRHSTRLNIRRRHEHSSATVDVTRPKSIPNTTRGLLMNKLGGDTTGHKDLEAPGRPKQASRRHLLHNVFDFLAIAATCIIFGLLYLLVKPVQRGFFCDDTSIQYPYKPDTIPMWLLGIYGGIGPVVIFLIVEIWVVRPLGCGRRGNRYSVRQRQVDYIKTIVQTVLLFALGIAICFLITEVGKRTIGRLRPYYITICNPVWSELQCTKTVIAASGSLAISEYVINHTCNSTASAADLKEAKLSFPSGHSSYSTFAFVFLFVYFEARLVCPRIQFLKPFLQCICIAVAFFTCLSRVTDFKHHPTDVIGGAIIGFTIAVFTAIRVGTYLWSFSIYCETEEHTKKDRLPKEERIPVPGIETTESGRLRSNNETPSQAMQQPHQRPSVARLRSDPRLGSDRDLKTMQVQNPVFNHSRRVAPAKAVDAINP